MSNLTEKELIETYEKQKQAIKQRLDEFKNLPQEDYFHEFIFCMLTPQSNAKKCWQAVEQLKKLDKLEVKEISEILKTKTRFHNNKAKYISEAKNTFELILPKLNSENKKKLRNEIAKQVKGYGLKEASHFLRNIGKSNNEIAILDRHILRNLAGLKVIEKEKIRNYKEIEEKFIDFSKRINIPIDELDLLFWSRENGEIFK